MPRSPSFEELVQQRLTSRERIAHAKAITEELTRRINLPLSLHEANRIIGYSDTLSSQIPASYAGHAFRDLTDAMFRYEVVQLLAVWDPPDPDLDRIAFSLQAVATLCDNNDVIGSLAEEHFRAHASRGTRFLSLPEDEALRSIATDVFERDQLQFAKEQANQCDFELRKAIEEVRDTVDAPYFIGLKNYRNKVAHSLPRTRIEKQCGSAIPVKYGYERELLNTTIKLIESFYCWVNGISFSIEDDCREFAKRCAEELWLNCKFQIDD